MERIVWSLCFLGAVSLVIKGHTIVAKTTRFGGLSTLANAFAAKFTPAYAA